MASARAETSAAVTGLLGCPDCDAVVRARTPAPGQMLRCPRCGRVLASGIEGGFVRALAYASAALVLMTIALGFPFVAVDASGLSNRVTLASSITSLTGDLDVIVVLLAVFVLLVPGGMMAVVALLTALLIARRSSPLLGPLARSLFHLNVWYMADVFAIGVIVSLVKLSSMADVLLGTAFWAYLGFAVCFLLAMTSLDRVAVWAAISALRRRA